MNSSLIARAPVHPNSRSKVASDPARGAIGWSLLYMIFGGGFVGAIVIYVIAKMLGS